MQTIYLTGCMGAGKSTTGRALAGSLGLAFLDLDEEIACSVGRTPAALIASDGEAAFRDVEAQVLGRIAADDGRVVALGGGTLTRAENLERVRATGRLVYLSASAEVLARRAQAEPTVVRPLLGSDPPGRMRDLLAAREATYLQSELRVDTEGKDVTAVAAEVQLRLGPATAAASASGTLDCVAVQLPSASYPIVFSAGERRRLGSLVRERFPDGEGAALVGDAEVTRRYGEEAARSLAAAGFEVARLDVPAGEASKSREQLARVEDFLLGARVDRHTPVVALGGGVLGDLTGFAAATVLRGVPWVQVPTTLLAQVDSSVGGKTGINHSLGKNLLGAFHQPSLVFVDTSYLRTLPLRDVRAGLAEVVKYGLIADPTLLSALEAQAETLAAGEPLALLPFIRRSCELKAAIVAEDERETTGRRALLNLGHTFGHALEYLAGYGVLRHGEAVAVGLCMAAKVSRSLGWCDDALVERVASLLRRLGLPTDLPFEPAALAEAMRHDKKLLGKRVHFILIEGAGRLRRELLEPAEVVRHLCG